LNLYLDTSIFVAALCDEASTERVLRWMHGQSDSQFITSRWTFTEFSSAVSIKVRTGQLTASHQPMLITRFNSLIFNQVSLVAVVDGDFPTAARFCENWQSGLRGGDALHLAIAATCADTLATLDNGLYRAARHFGIAALIP